MLVTLVLSQLIQAEELSEDELKDKEYMKNKVNAWLDMGIISDEQYIQYHEELGLKLEQPKDLKC